MQRDPFRLWVSRNIQTIVFLGSYFVTVVAGNLIFASPLVRELLRASRSSPRFLDFPHTFTLGYWTLLLCPFVITPIVVAGTRRAFGRWVAAGTGALPEFSRMSYVVVATLLFGCVIYKFWLADVARLFVSVDPIEARFTIRARIGFLTLIPLQALLPYLTLYAFIRWITLREAFWMACAFVGFLMLSVLLVMINMRWPVLLFYVGIALATFVYAKRRAYLKSVVGVGVVVLAFLGISLFVLLVPLNSRQVEHKTVAGERADEVGGVARAYADLLLAAMNRMAISYPYYYQVFTAEGPVCGGILTQAHRRPACRPSEMIYTRIFGNDGFEHRGTAPLSVHISGYALGGWAVAIMALIAGSVILGLFSAVPLDAGPTAGALVILGALTGYHLSQIPGEGVVFYEHGLLWIGLLVFGHALWRRATAKS